MSARNLDDCAFLQSMVDQLPDAVVFADCEGIIGLWNPRAAALFGYSTEEAIGRSLDIIVPEHLRPAHWTGYRRAIAAGHGRPDAKPMLTRAVHKDGSRIYVEFAFAIVLDDAGRVLGAVATARAASRPTQS
jgi:PAS domain S-box-containing protein